MKLYEVIEKEVDDIVAEWVDFARSLSPTARNLSDNALRDHARVLLLATAADMRNPQRETTRHDKSQGNAPAHSPDIRELATEHAKQRFFQGFSLDQMVSEYRALRASVVRRWTAHLDPVNRETLDELTRFNETVDQALWASIAWYSAKVDESRSLLLGALGHDLRNPLGVVKLSASYLQGGPDLTGTQAKAVSRVLVAAERMRKMVDDLLDFTQTSLGTLLPISPGVADFGHLCRRVVEELEALHPSCQITLSTSGELDGNWDGSRIEQLLSNLVSNALLHGDPGKIVTVTATGDSESVIARIHNEGRAIPADQLGNLFEPLRQSLEMKADRHVGSSGLGLGLYIACEIAISHGGSIDVESTPEDGTTFTVRLPRARLQPAP